MKGILLVVLLATSVAQAFPGCSGEDGREIIGFVDEKRTSQRGGDTEYVLVVNRTPYSVPAHFWLRADVGDIVKYDGLEWTIVRKRSQ